MSFKAVMTVAERYASETKRRLSWNEFDGRIEGISSTNVTHVSAKSDSMRLKSDWCCCGGLHGYCDDPGAISEYVSTADHLSDEEPEDDLESDCGVHHGFLMFQAMSALTAGHWAWLGGASSFLNTP
ncbi:hypothetical protein PRIPAC_95482, partial [Pristionchus pacificus]|uniref:Uncharacterized protein n=1 Tax=Pristionchus pacificus TaxID=54126 RepID=A0A2A6D153_PRIPA